MFANSPTWCLQQMLKGILVLALFESMDVHCAQCALYSVFASDFDVLYELLSRIKHLKWSHSVLVVPVTQVTCLFLLMNRVEGLTAKVCLMVRWNYDTGLEKNMVQKKRFFFSVFCKLKDIISEVGYKRQWQQFSCDVL